MESTSSSSALINRGEGGGGGGGGGKKNMISANTFRSKFNAGIKHTKKNNNQIITKINWSGLNLKGILLKVGTSSYTGKDGKPKTKYDLRVMILPFRGDECGDFKNTHAMFVNPRVIKVVTIPPNKDPSGATLTKSESRIPTNQEDMKFYFIRPHDVLFLSLFNDKIAETRKGSIIDIINVTSNAFWRSNGECDSSIHAKTINFVKNSYKIDTIIDALNGVDPFAKMLAPFTTVDKHAGYIIKFVPIDFVPDEELNCSRNIQASIIVPSEDKAFIIESNDDSSKRICAKLTAYATQWKFGNDNDVERILLSFILWDDQCKTFGITDPDNWRRLAPYFLQCPFTGVFTVDLVNSVSMPCNRNQQDSDYNNNLQLDCDDPEADKDFVEENPNDHYKFALATRVQFLHFELLPFMTRYLIPVSGQFVKKNAKLLKESFSTNDSNEMNNGLFGEKFIKCISEIGAGFSKEAGKYYRMYEQKLGRFGIMTDDHFKTEQMKKLQYMSVSEGENFFNSLPKNDNRVIYLWFLNEEAFEFVNKLKESEGGKTALKNCKSLMRIDLYSEFFKNSSSFGRSQPQITDIIQESQNMDEEDNVDELNEMLDQIEDDDNQLQKKKKLRQIRQEEGEKEENEEEEKEAEEEEEEDEEEEEEEEEVILVVETKKKRNRQSKDSNSSKKRSKKNTTTTTPQQPRTRRMMTTVDPR